MNLLAMIERYTDFTQLELMKKKEKQHKSYF